MEKTYNEKNPTIIIQNQNGVLGLLVDGIVDIKDIKKGDIDTIPEHYNDEKISGVINVNNQLISIISYKILDSLIEKHKNQGQGELFKNSKEREKEDFFDIVIFSINKKEYAFNMNNVEEIIRYSQITQLPNSPKILKGMINLRGEIIPIISLHQRMNIEETIKEETKILICKEEDRKFGFLVDNVNQVLDISQSNLQANDNEEALFPHAIMLDNGERIVLEVDIGQIINEDQLTKITHSMEKA